MNYRHVYHAGNHTEVFKHAVLVSLINALHEKPKAIFVLDTHSGEGLYDLDSNEAKKTAEAANGILRIQCSQSVLLRPYLDIVRRFNDNVLRYYPGSPAIIAESLRAGDRAVMCEFHDEDFRSLQQFLVNRVGTLAQHRSGYEAMLALLPPLERRGLIFIDPPYEEANEMEVLRTQLLAAFRKWSTGIFACWYPIKDKRKSRLMRNIAAEYFLPKSLVVEFIPWPIDEETLAGSGILLVNTPWKFDLLLRALCSDLERAFDSPSSAWSVDWICEPG